MKSLLILFSLFLMTSTVEAQNDSAINLYRSGFIENRKKNKWVKPLIASAYAGASYLCYRYFDTKIQKVVQSNKNGFETFISNTVTDLGLGKSQTIGILSTTALAFILKDNKLKKTVIIWGGSLLINGLLTNEAKIIFQRHRPSSGDAYNVFDWGKGQKINTSFISAHTSNAFTTATVFATMYRDHKWVPPVAYGLAGLVGLSRIYDNAHWASDVMVGAASGFLSAKLMVKLYKLAGKKIKFLPQVSASYSSVSMVYQF
jgi:membrane-associated phospholipid phosphatase